LRDNSSASPNRVVHSLIEATSESIIAGAHASPSATDSWRTAFAKASASSNRP
jgi:hypothetical protein